MKRLILMRHAKSDWSGGTVDHKRPLNTRGRQSAAALGTWLRQTGYLPDRALCSTSERTRETLSRLGIEATTTYEDRLYHAGPVALRMALANAGGAETVLMIAHNPGICAFAHEIVTARPRHPRFEDYPTGATLVADFNIASWSDLEGATGTVRDFVIPRELLETL